MQEETSKKFSGIASKFSISPQEEMVKISTRPDKLYIGIPKETAFQENRVPLTPETVSVLVAQGHRIIIESQAGKGSFFKDSEYQAAGAEVVFDVKKVYEANIIIKVAPPSKIEIELLKTHQTLISPIHLPTLRDSYIRNLMNKKITALAFEYIKDVGNTFPLVRSMSEIAGSTAILVAAQYLSSGVYGRRMLFGGVSGVPPVRVVILGAGMVGESAARASIGLGANVKIFDNNVYKLMRLQNNIGMRLYTSFIYPDVLELELKNADVVIGAIHSESGRTPMIVSERMVQQMKPGSLIIDISIDQGGCFETSEVTDHENPVFVKHDVLHYCVPNISSRVSRTASYAMSNILSNILMKASQSGSFERLLSYDSGTRHGVYIYKGCLTNQHLSERFQIKFTDLELLFASSF